MIMMMWRENDEGKTNSSAEDGVVSTEAMNGSILEVEGEDTAAGAVFHDQIESKVLDEEGAVIAEGLAVEGVKKGVSRSICSSAATDGLSSLSKLETLSTKGTLIDLSLGRSRKGQTVVLEFDDNVGSFTTHVMNCILVTCLFFVCVFFEG